MERPRFSVSWWRIGAVAVCIACGGLLVMSAQASGGLDLRSSDTVELVDLVRHHDEQNQELASRVDELTLLIDELQEARSTTESEEVQRAIDEVAMAAGVAPVVGPGLMVELADADRPSVIPPELNVEDYLVHQQDVEGVLNALWAGGAEAVMVKDQRIISTSSVRCVGPVLLLNGRTYDQPYTIQAIGDADELREALDESPQVSAYANQAEVIGLGFQVEDQEEISMPAYEGGLGVTVRQ